MMEMIPKKHLEKGGKQRLLLNLKREELELGWLM